MVDGADELPWKHLLSFPRCFYRPSRSGKRHNLTSCTLAQIEALERGCQLIAPPDSGGGAGMQNLASKSKKSKPGVSETARRASMKLGDGDIKRVVGVLCSEDDYLPPNMAAFNILLEKHPPQPSVETPLLV